MSMNNKDIQKVRSEWMEEKRNKISSNGEDSHLFQKLNMQNQVQFCKIFKRCADSDQVPLNPFLKIKETVKNPIIFVESLDKRGSHLRLVNYLSKTFHGHQFILILQKNLTHFSSQSHLHFRTIYQNIMTTTPVGRQQIGMYEPRGKRGDEIQLTTKYGNLQKRSIQECNCHESE